MEQLEQILKKYSFPKRTLNAIMIFDGLERGLVFDLPEDYKYFLSNYIEHECFIGPEYLRLWDLDNLLENNKGYQIQECLDNTIGIGSNGGGECLAIELLSHGKYRVVLTPFIFEKECHIEIGTSFTDMLNRLDNGINWFK